MSLKKVVKELLTVAGDSICNEFFQGEAEINHVYQSRELEGFDSVVKAKGITYNRVDNYGGEGMGEEYWSVYSFNNDDELVYVKFDGYYASYNGADFSRWFFVDPKEVVVTQWFSQE